MRRRRPSFQEFSNPQQFTAEEKTALDALRRELSGKKPGDFTVLSGQFMEQHHKNLFRPLAHLMESRDNDERQVAMKATANLVHQALMSDPYSGFCRDVMSFYTPNARRIISPLASAVAVSGEPVAGTAVNCLAEIVHDASKPEIGYQLRAGVAGEKVVFTAEEASKSINEFMHGTGGSIIFEGLPRRDHSTRIDAVGNLLGDFAVSLEQSTPVAGELTERIESASDDNERNFFQQLLKVRQRIDALVRPSED